MEHVPRIYTPRNSAAVHVPLIQSHQDIESIKRIHRTHEQLRLVTILPGYSLSSRNSCDDRYLYELGDYTTTALVTATGIQASLDRETMVYAELRLIDGCHHYDMNELGDCRKSWEESLRVRKKLLDPNDQGSRSTITELWQGINKY